MLANLLRAVDISGLHLDDRLSKPDGEGELVFKLWEDGKDLD